MLGAGVVLVVVEEVFIVRLLLVRLRDFFAYVILVDKCIVVLLASVVQVGVKVEELAPPVVDFVKLPLDLLADVNKVFPRHGVVHHHSPATFLPHLGREVVAFFFEIVDLLSRVGKHVLERGFCILHKLHRLCKLFRRAAPSRHIF